MDDRFGLFTIIVLGEAIVAVAGGATDTGSSVGTAVTAMGGFVLAVSFWCLYFEYADATVVHRVVRAAGRRAAVFRWILYGYGHLALYAAITATGVGVGAVLETVATSAPLSLGIRLILAGGVAAFLVGLVVVQWASPEYVSRVILRTRLVAAAFVLAVALLGGVWLSPSVVIGVLALVVVGVVAFEVPRTRDASVGLRARPGD